jgi:hypothetical protein
MLFAAPGIKLRLIETKFTGCGSHTNMLSKLQGFIEKFRCVLLTCFLLVNAGFVMSYFWLRVYSLSRVSTIRG